MPLKTALVIFTSIASGSIALAHARGPSDARDSRSDLQTEYFRQRYAEKEVSCLAQAERFFGINPADVESFEVERLGWNTSIYLKQRSSGRIVRYQEKCTGETDGSGGVPWIPGLGL